MSNTIKIKNYLNVQEEIIAIGVITPGMLLELTSAGKVQAHSASGQNMFQYFAVEDELQGEEITDTYAVADPVQVWIPQRGDIVYALLADGENASIGDYLESNGDGYLKVYAVDAESVANYTNQIVGQAIEAVDMSDSSGVDPAGRIKVRII
jgi:hypothetical protein